MQRCLVTVDIHKDAISLSTRIILPHLFKMSVFIVTKTAFLNMHALSGARYKSVDAFIAFIFITERQD